MFKTYNRNWTDHKNLIIISFPDCRANGLWLDHFPCAYIKQRKLFDSKDRCQVSVSSVDRLSLLEQKQEVNNLCYHRVSRS